MSLARVTIAGTVAADPERRYTSENNVPVTTFELLVPMAPSRRAQAAGEQEFFVLKVVCWRQLGDAVAEQVRKGEAVSVEGRLMIGSVQSADGSNKKLFEVDANSVERLVALPVAVLVAQGASGTTTGAAAPAGGRVNTNAPLAQHQPQPAMAGSSPAQAYASTAVQAPTSYVAPAGAASDPFDALSESLMTEDDIPF
ncbi:MAG: single-stranded DNA-binding protein [Candidatus Melainabacteria bacterium]|nr:single-stranded DNA-binding protein [Candidatus Melainabacteria bacterium]